MTNPSDYGDLARAWWAVHGPNGTIASIDDWSPEVTDQVADVDRTVESLSNDSESIAPLLGALVEVAPIDASLAFLGTFLLEDVRELSSDDILRAVEAAGLSEEEKKSILSGYVYREG